MLLLNSLTSLSEVSTLPTDYRNSIRAPVRGLWMGVLDRGQFLDSMEISIERYLHAGWDAGAAKYDVTPDDYELTDTNAIEKIVRDEMSHLPDFADWIEDHDKPSGTKIEVVLARADLWANRYNDVYNQALTHFGADEKLEWAYGKTEHCVTCNALNGWVKRASFWQKFYDETGIRPQAEALACHGYRCQCKLRPTKKPLSKGRPPSLAEVAEEEEGHWVTINGNPVLMDGPEPAGHDTPKKKLKPRKSATMGKRTTVKGEGGIAQELTDDQLKRTVTFDELELPEERDHRGAMMYNDDEDADGYPSQLKAKVCTALEPDLFPLGDADKMRVEARAIVHQWAETSNDNSKDSFRIQLAISEEFKAPLSDWQKQRIEELGGEKAVRMYRHNKNANFESSLLSVRHGVRGMYNRTQEEFKQKGIKEVTVYRGIGSSANSLPHGKTARIVGNAAESWSFDPQTARSFGSGGRIFKMKVPVSRVLSTFRTGFGCANEHEVLILSTRKASDKALVLDYYRTK